MAKRIAVDLAEYWEGLAGLRLSHLEPKQLGAVGEEIACRELISRGWSLLDRNVRVSRDEVDLLFYFDGDLHVVEVKTRSGYGFGLGRESVTPAKLAKMRRAATTWLGTDRPSRLYRSICFDCAEITVVTEFEVEFDLIERIESP
ncbi:YraN family protein [Corynebacterium lactis]|nr:YraN family protein [Corynebacterium lactis]